MYASANSLPFELCKNMIPAAGMASSLYAMVYSTLFVVPPSLWLRRHTNALAQCRQFCIECGVQPEVPYQKLPSLSGGWIQNGGRIVLVCQCLYEPDSTGTLSSRGCRVVADGHVRHHSDLWRFMATWLFIGKTRKKTQRNLGSM